MGESRHKIASLHQLVVLFVAISQICSASGSSNFTLLNLPDIIGVWNRSRYSANQFRNDSVVGYFGIWPENMTEVKFVFYCEDPGKGNLSLNNFTYSDTEGRLDPRPYFDLGIVESYQPYWKHWWFWKVDTKKLTYAINCEHNDIYDLYSYRFWQVTMRDGCTGAAVMQGVIQIIVAVVLSIRWGWSFCRCSSEKRVQLLKSWFWNLHSADFFSEVVHLFLLVLVGYCMMEAIGHSDLHTWRPMVMYNTGVVYSYLSAFAVLSSIFRQVAHGWMDREKLYEFELSKLQNKLDVKGEIWFKLQDISDDWRWQRVFGQLGVLVLMGTYLSFVDDASKGGVDQLAGLVLAATVVACIWSYGVTAVVSFRSLSHILAQMCPGFARFAIGRVSPRLRSESEVLDGEGEGEAIACARAHRTSARSRSFISEV